MIKRTLLFCMPVFGSCFLLVNDLGPTLCDEGSAARCDGNTLVTCEAGIENRLSCGGFACNVEEVRCGECGDNFIDTQNGEVCDDGNVESGDGCRDDCGGLEECGDNFIDELVGEVCDDGNAFSGDGCSDDCESDESCGNGLIDVAEVNNLPADTIQSLTFEYLVTGCGINQESLTFRVNGTTILSPPINNACSCLPGIESFTVADPGIVGLLNDQENTFEVQSNTQSDVIVSWAVVVANSAQENADIIVVDISGNSAAQRIDDLCFGNTGSPFEFSTATQGISEFINEVCDDANSEVGDGCDAGCINEIGFLCNGQPSSCFDVCGNGVVEAAAGENCDDANNVDTDACPNDCTIP
jgi:cysteine-rich repeat protein